MTFHYAETLIFLANFHGSLLPKGEGEKHDCRVERALAVELEDAILKPDSLLAACRCGQGTDPLWASVPSSVKWAGWIGSPPPASVSYLSWTQRLTTAASHHVF